MFYGNDNITTEREILVNNSNILSIFIFLHTEEEASDLLQNVFNSFQTSYSYFVQVIILSELMCTSNTYNLYLLYIWSVIGLVSHAHTLLLIWK